MSRRVIFFAGLFFLLAGTIARDPHEAEFLNFKTTYLTMDRQIYDIAREESALQDFPLSVTLAFIYAESRFNPRAVSRSGAIGLMQIMPFWHAAPKKLFDSRTNVRYGIAILRYCIRDAQNNLIISAKYYNAGKNGVSFIEKYVAEIIWCVSVYDRAQLDSMLKV